MAFIRKTMQSLQRLTPEQFRDIPKIPLVVILDNIRSLNNVGSVFRTADAFRVQEIICCGYTPTPPHRDIRKTALGAEDAVAWRYIPDVGSAIAELRQQGFAIIAVEQAEGSTDLSTWHPTGPVALVLGNEVEGVSDKVLAEADMCLEIPQDGTKHSLNVSVSTGIVLWQAYVALSNQFST